ncbi:type IV pilus twitching motility protein PilT [bacterium]|nr:type IV pilus twitching motility protein PilT [bacterium]
MLEAEKLLQMVVDRNASDLHIHVNRPPVLRIDGKLHPLDMKSLKPEDTQAFMEAISPQRYQEQIKEMGSADFGYTFKDQGRFRVCIYRQMGAVAISMRLIPTKLLTLEELGLPASVKDLLHRPRGLVLVTGPTGSGKTTTLATMIDIINSEQDCHIITVEDPIEYYHSHKMSIVTQREVGIDTPSFAEALVRGLRQDPDVILVGEMRDLATIEAAITAAETGHLVFATLHTNSASQTVDRAIDVFPPHQQQQIRMMLSVSLAAVFCQKLLPKASGKGRVAAFEIMMVTPAIANMIREMKTHRLLSAIQTGTRYGMKTMDQSLFELYQRGLITYQEAMIQCHDKEEMQKLIQEKR